ncbi:MAG: hypothetical protein OEM49_12355 [Myxococcales bacterium]|nr:hypothetical protein [Myxococcales bacterium]MDH5565445.1 hypothetical protein [Myxococcales bacterium]
MSHPHTSDSDCTLTDLRTCSECGVYHGDLVDSFVMVRRQEGVSDKTVNNDLMNEFTLHPGVYKTGSATGLLQRNSARSVFLE